MSARPSSFTNYFTEPGPLRLYSLNEVLRMPPPEWLIAPIVPLGGLVSIYAKPESYKSFVALDMALSVASGRPWQNHPTGSGFVLYVAAEGHTGISKRAAAWLKTHAVPPKKTSIAFLTVGISIQADGNDMDVLMERVTDEVQRTPTLVVIDTLARCFDGDENQQEDMGRFIGGVDRMRREFGATVLIVHHTRLDGDRERGNTAFRGAADTMIAITRKNTSLVLSCNKQKDAERFPDEHYTMVEVPVTLTDARGVSVNTESCIVSGDPKHHAKKENLGEILHVLRTQGPLSWDAWFQLLKPSGLARTTFHRRVVELKEKGEILKQNGKWALKTST